MYQFLEQLRSLTTATEQATQTFATSQAEELFHPQLEALLVTWLSNKLPEVVRKRAHNRRPQPSARILLTEFYFTLFQTSWQYCTESDFYKSESDGCHYQY